MLRYTRKARSVRLPSPAPPKPTSAFVMFDDDDDLFIGRPSAVLPARAKRSRATKLKTLAKTKPPAPARVTRPSPDAAIHAARILATRAKAMLPGASELIIQIAIADLLRERAIPGCYWYSVPNGANVSGRERGKLSASGMRSGVPDIMFVMDGRALGMELKRAKGGSVSPEQRACHREIVGAGGVVAVARGYEAAVSVLVGWGVLSGA